MRVGTGYDLHRFRVPAEGSLRLGGIEVPGAPSLEGHSDGDALIHAIIDALLGAAGEGDIGRHFPPGDESTRGIDSRIGLRGRERGMAQKLLDRTQIAPRIQ